MDIKLNNFSGGLNINVAPDDLPEQTIELCENWEYVATTTNNEKEHSCNDMDQDARMGVNKIGNWFLHTGDPTDLVWINYCPFCGEKL